MGELVPDTDREQLYERWYELSVLYHEAIRLSVDPGEAKATKSMADEAWEDYVACVTAGIGGVGVRAVVPSVAIIPAWWTTFSR